MTTSPTIYLDNNATTALDPEVREAMAPYLTDFAGNPSSRHGLGRVARRAIDEARDRIAAGLGCWPDEIVFTSGATESNNLAIHGITGPAGSTVLLNPTEHPSSLAPTVALAGRGFAVRMLSVDEEGRLIGIRDDATSRAILAVIQLANSETGTIQDIAAVRTFLPVGCRLHVDATQAIGRIPCRFRELGSTTLSFSGHKIHGPPGIGGLVIRRGTGVAALFVGGEQQDGVRAGTEPVALIVGLGRAVELATSRLAEYANRLASVRDRLETKLLTSVPDVVRNGCIEHRLPNTSNLSFLGTDAEALLIALDLADVCASAGTACASGSLEPSPVLQAMGIVGDRLKSAIRFSVSRFTSDLEVDRAAERIALCVQRVRSTVRHE